MVCGSCRRAVSRGSEIVLEGLSDQPSHHCPYCLEPLNAPPPDLGVVDAQPAENVSVERHANRRAIRARFVEELGEQTADGRPICPSCGRVLERNDLLILLNSEYFRCHLCGHDIAAYAYREEAYQERRWLPVIHALGDMHRREECRDCHFAGAMASSCQNALTWIGHGSSEHHKLLVAILAHSDWRRPDCDTSACFALTQYRTLAGKGLELL